VALQELEPLCEAQMELVAQDRAAVQKHLRAVQVRARRLWGCAQSCHE
jgi:hypothetical protein